VGSYGVDVSDEQGTLVLDGCWARGGGRNWCLTIKFDGQINDLSGRRCDTCRAVAEKLGRFQSAKFSEIEDFVPGRDMQSVHLNNSVRKSEIFAH
jgi:hypothetical protein